MDRSAQAIGANSAQTQDHIVTLEHLYFTATILMSEPSNKLRTTLDILKGGASTDGGDVSVVVFTATDYCHASRALAALLADKLVAHVRFDVPLLESGDATLPLQEEQPSIDTGGGVAKANDTALVRSAGLSQEAMRYFEVDAVPAIIFVQRANPTLRVPPSIAPTALREATQALLAAVQLPQSGEPHCRPRRRRPPPTATLLL